MTSLVLGERTYDQAALLALMHAPPRGDASLILVKQLIAAKLNVAAGASSIAAIAEADAWIDLYDDDRTLPFGIHASTPEGGEAIRIASVLAAYNEGEIGPGYCPTGRPPIVRCDEGLINCGGTCVDPSTNAQHCGDCGNACAIGQLCVSSVCTTQDAGAPSMDAGMPDAGPMAPDAGAMMDAGPPPTDAGMDAGPPPTDAGTDAGPPPTDAGMDAGPAVDAGTDAGVCPAGFTNCGGNCVNLQTDSTHCGSCGNDCQPGDTCEFGGCMGPCPLGDLDCDGVEENGCEARLDRNHCGACDFACENGGGTFCRWDYGFGYPVCDTCPAGTADCDARGDESAAYACEVDISTDPANCGACGTACASNQACSEGSCIGVCPVGFSNCNGTCADLQTDDVNCGQCFWECTSGATCEQGLCGGCEIGALDCDGIEENGCEAVLNRNHCGECGFACESSGATFCQFDWANDFNPICEQCPTGRADCDAVGSLFPAVGCEVDILNDPANCGGCGNACGAGIGCSNGSCGGGGASDA